jgi:hypothetical protein
LIFKASKALSLTLSYKRPEKRGVFLLALLKTTAKLILQKYWGGVLLSLFD